MPYPMKVIKGYVNTKPGIQVATKWQGKITRKGDGTFVFDRDGINLLKQLNVEWVMVGDIGLKSADDFRSLRTQIEDLGFKVYRIANDNLHNMPEITLNLPGRDAKIDQYLEYIASLGEGGIRYATYAHMANGIWEDNLRRPVRGGAVSRGLNLKLPNKGVWGKRENAKVYEWPLSHGRKYSEDELWENYEYFIKKVKPVAESADVYIGIHPDDPPGIEMAGIPRKIFGTFEGYKKALAIADSDHIGACLCVGCWLEGGVELCGSTPEEFIRYFASQNKLFKLHMRNVTAPLLSAEGFGETFPDAGYYNLINIIKCLAEVKFDGAIINDHLIDMTGGPYVCEAAFTSYLKGIVDTIQNVSK